MLIYTMRTGRQCETIRKKLTVNGFNDDKICSKMIFEDFSVGLKNNIYMSDHSDIPWLYVMYVSSARLKFEGFRIFMKELDVMNWQRKYNKKIGIHAEFNLMIINMYRYYTLLLENFDLFTTYCTKEELNEVLLSFPDKKSKFGSLEYIEPVQLAV